MLYLVFERAAFKGKGVSSNNNITPISSPMKTKLSLLLTYLLLASFGLAGCNKHSSNDADKAKVQVGIDQEQQAANSGDVAAQYKLAERYVSGAGVTQDYTRAFKWFLKSAEGGNVEAMIQVADWLTYGRGVSASIEESNKWWRKAAEAGNAKAQHEYAQTFGLALKGLNWVMGSTPTEKEQNLSNWLSWLEKSAAQGYADAKYDLGMLYLLGIKKDPFTKGDKSELLIPPAPDKGVPLLLEAAKKNNWNAQWALAVLYQAGFGQIQPDSKLSDEWWGRLEAQSDAHTHSD